MTIYSLAGAIYVSVTMVVTFFIYRRFLSGDDFGWSDHNPNNAYMVQNHPFFTALLVGIMWPLLIFFIDFRAPNWGLRAPEYDEMVIDCDNCNAQFIARVHHGDSTELQEYNADRAAIAAGWSLGDDSVLCNNCTELTSRKD